MYKQLVSLLIPLLFSVYSNFTHWLEANMLTCPSKKYLHIECPGCGLQRGFIALLQGDIPASLRVYPATIPLLLLFSFTLLHLKYEFRQGATVIKCLQWGIAIIIVVFYIYKIVNHKIIA
jgi:Protein of unknown function (DUF2752)